MTEPWAAMPEASCAWSMKNLNRCDGGVVLMEKLIQILKAWCCGM